MRDVDDHAEVVHGPDDFAPEVRQPAVPPRVARGVAPVVRVHVRQRHVARAAAVELAQRDQRVLDGVPPFDADHDGGLAAALRGADARGVVAAHEHARVARHLGFDQVDEAVRELPRAAPGVERRHVRGEERRGDAALPQRLQVDLRLGVVLVEMDVAPQHAVRRVAVAVDDDGAAVDVIR